MLGEQMALKVIYRKIGKLKLLYRKNRFLSPELHEMTWNALIQPDFDYAYPAWYPNLTEKKKNIKIMQNKYIKFCLKLAKMDHISEEVLDR